MANKTVTSKPAQLKRKTQTGTLRIGNQWNAINIIAHSQTHPLKAVCELTENAIDAKAEHIQIVRRRSKGQIYLDVIDDGHGVHPTETGEPDFGRIATHVCDSMKRHLAVGDRSGIHGEFGIGLLSFWSLGESFRMVSAGSSSQLFEMSLERGKRTYTVKPVRGVLVTGGTRVTVGPLLQSTRKIVTGDKLSRYLSTELRDRIRSSEVQVCVVDRVSRKEFLVEPRQFEGEQVEVPRTLSTPFGEIRVELYFRDVSNEGDAGLAVCKDGTRVLKDITELGHFQHAPWNEGRFDGILDFPAFAVAPGTRGGIVPDEKLAAFVEAVSRLEVELIDALDNREQAETDKASRDILRQVHKAFRNALRELPSDEYMFFDIPEPRSSLGGAGKRAGAAATESFPIQQAAPNRQEGDPPAEQGLLPLEPGPLHSVRISPRHSRRPPGEECLLTAMARDAHGLRIREGVHFEWSLSEGEAVLAADGDSATLRSSITGAVVINVSAAAGDLSAMDRVTVKFLEESPKSNDDAAQGLPSYRLDPEHGKPWRSRYDAKRNEIVINSAHRDFLSSRTSAAKHRRYIGKLYAKEVVLINFPHESPAEVMERLIQVTLRTEDVL